MSSANSQLSDLVALIANATKTVEALFRSSSERDVPSLDDINPHPFDTGISSMEMRQAIQIIEGACAQLCAAVSRPNHTVLNKLMQIYEPACLNVAAKFKIPDILQEQPQGMHISELAQKTGVEMGKLSRVLRLLATKHCFREVATDVFANNRISLELLSANPLSSLALHFGDENNKATALLAEVLGDPEWGQSYSTEHSAFGKWSESQSLFSYYEGGDSEARRRGARFDIAMLGWSAATEAGAVIQRFPWGELRDGASVCDVGGGIGFISMQLAKAYPTLQLKLQDLPAAIERAKMTVWPKECPEAIQENRIEFKAINFLTESPIGNCDVYYMKHIIHDWPHRESIRILSGVRAAMGTHSRLLIHEYILQHVNRVPNEQSKFMQAPEPLLPNYGVGRVRQYSLDIDMMVMVNSQERRLNEFIELGREAGLKFVKLWDLGETGLIEFRLTDGEQ